MSRQVVVGGGNGGQALAADLASRGYDIALLELPEFAVGLGDSPQTGTLELTEQEEVKEVPVTVTTEAAAAMAGARTVHVVVPAHGHAKTFENLLPHLGPEIDVIVWSGRLGSLELLRMIESAGAPRCTIAEINTLPYGARLNGPGRPEILYRSTKLIGAAVPASGTERIVAEIAKDFPEIEAVDNVVAAAIANSSLLVLPTGTVLNAAWIERAPGQFSLMREGLSPGVTRVISELNREFADLAGAFGGSVPVYPDEVVHGIGSVEAANFRGPDPDSLTRLTGPPALDSRYLRENIPFGLFPLVELGRVAGVEMPVARSLVDLAKAILGPGLLESPRTLGSLGLDGLSVDAIVKHVRGEYEPIGGGKF